MIASGFRFQDDESTPRLNLDGTIPPFSPLHLYPLDVLAANGYTVWRPTQGEEEEAIPPVIEENLIASGFRFQDDESTTWMNWDGTLPPLPPLNRYPLDVLAANGYRVWRPIPGEEWP